MPPWMTPAFSTLNCTSPPFAASTAVFHVHRHGADFRVRHQVGAGRGSYPRRPTSGIMSGVAMQRSNSILPDWIVLHQVLGADDIGTGGLGFVSLGATGEYRHAHGFARAVRQLNHAADHLVGVTRVNTQVHRDFQRLVEFRRSGRLDQLDGLFDRQVRLVLEKRCARRRYVYPAWPWLTLSLRCRRTWPSQG